MKVKWVLLLSLLLMSANLVSCGPSQVELDDQATQAGITLDAQATETADSLAATRTQVYVEYQESHPTRTPTEIMPSPTTTHTATPQALVYEPIATKVSEIDGMEMVYVPGGRFIMGLSDDDKAKLCGSDCNEELFLFEMGGVQPQHNVYLDAY